MLSNNTISPGMCQPPEHLKDLKANGKPRPWKQRKQGASLLSVVYDLLAESDPDRAAKYLNKAQRTANCAPFAEFQMMPDGSKRLHNSSFCRCRLCPMCQWRRSLKLGAQVRAVVSAANAAKISRDKASYGWLLLTVTVQNVPGKKLSAEIDHIHHALNNMAKSASWKAAVKGWLRATEVTRNYNQKSAWYGTYHPHMHLLLCVNASYFKGKAYLKKSDWADMWKHYAGLDYNPVIDIQTIKTIDGQNINDLPESERAASMGKACAEVSKYAAKPADYLRPEDLDLSAETVALLDDTLENRRMTSWGGVLKETAKQLKLDDIENGDLVHVEAETEDPDANKIADYVTYCWAVGAGDYVKYSERTGDNPSEERRKKTVDKKQVAAKRRASADKGVTAKARKDADREMRPVYLTTEAAAAIEALFDQKGSVSDGKTEETETLGQSPG